ncbi:MAG: stalk domain-containing protein [Caldisericia bacterium]
MKKMCVFMLVFLLVISIVPTILGENPTRKAVLKVGSNKAIVDGEEIELDAPPAIISGRTMVPLRFIQEQLLPDCSDIDWNGATREVTIDNIPIAQLDCTYVASLQAEIAKLVEENEELKTINEELMKENNPSPEEDTVPPIEYSKNGIDFTLKSVTKERGPIIDGDRTYHLRLNIKIQNLTEKSCRFPADRTKMIIDGETYTQVGYDKTFINSIPGGAEVRLG